MSWLYWVLTYDEERIKIVVGKVNQTSETFINHVDWLYTGMYIIYILRSSQVLMGSWIKQVCKRKMKFFEIQILQTTITKGTVRWIEWMNEWMKRRINHQKYRSVPFTRSFSRTKKSGTKKKVPDFLVRGFVVCFVRTDDEWMNETKNQSSKASFGTFYP